MVINMKILIVSDTHHRNENYLKIIRDNAREIMNKKLKYNIDNGFANEEQTRLYYKYFE